MRVQTSSIRGRRKGIWHVTFSTAWALQAPAASSGAAGWMKQIFRKHIFWLLASFLGGLSLLALLRYGFALSIGPFFRGLLRVYEKCLAVLFGWAESVITQLAIYINWPLVLGPH